MLAGVRSLGRPVGRLSSHVIQYTQTQHAAGPSRLSVLPFRRAITMESVASGTSLAPPLPSSADSLFDTSESGWEHVFRGIDPQDPPVLSSPQSRNRFLARQQTMTAREIKVFDKIFQMVFTAASGQEGQNISADTSIGRTPGSARMDQLTSQLKQARKVQWTTDTEEDLDKKREQMNLCTTDIQLLDWAMQEVFGESKRYEEAAQRAAQDPSAPRVTQLQSPGYPYLIAALMRTFRDKYADPHLALAIFDHARHLSVPSFVFGCTTFAYNELIETRWKCFRDVRGVLEALEEMRVNGVETNTRTRTLVETVRSQVGQRTLWEEESDISTNNVGEMLRRIEELVALNSTKRHEAYWSNKRWTDKSELWKSSALRPDSEKDGWEFGKWDFTESPKESRFSNPPRSDFAFS